MNDLGGGGGGVGGGGDCGGDGGWDEGALALLSVEALEDELSTLAARVAASTCRFLLVVAEYDRRQAFASWECHDMASWLSWKCGISPVTAREQVRVARCLGSFAVVRERFLRGTLSYSQVRAICRVVTAETEVALVDLATISTAAQLETLTAAYRRSRESCTDTERRRYRSRYLQMHYDDDGCVVGSFRLPPETGAVVVGAVGQLVQKHRVDAADVDAEPVDPEPVGKTGVDGRGAGSGDGGGDGYGARCADALVELVGAGAEHLAEVDPDGDDRRYLVTVVVDADTLSDNTDAGDDTDAGGPGEIGPVSGGPGGVGGGGPGGPGGVGGGDDRAAVVSAGVAEPGVCQIVGGPGLCPQTARQVACDAAVVSVIEDKSAGLVDLGRRTRRPSRALRRALRLRDGCCQFPGCTRIRTEAHHIVHWIDGGATDLANLVSLCGFHHHRLHEGGYRIAGEPGGSLCFVHEDGRVLPQICALGPTCDDPEPHVDPYRSAWDGTAMPYAEVIEGLLQSDHHLHRDQPPPDSAESSPRCPQPTIPRNHHQGP